MRIEPGTYIAAAGRLALASLAVLAGCSGPGHGTARTPAGPLTVYVSVPRHGVESSAGEAVAAGVRLALSDAQGRAGDRDVRLVQLDDSKPGGFTLGSRRRWRRTRSARPPTRPRSPTSASSTRAARRCRCPSPTTPGFLQVSPLDGLTTLTRDQPGAAPGTGPARYYPSGKRTLPAARAEGRAAGVRARRLGRRARRHPARDRPGRRGLRPRARPAGRVRRRARAHRRSPTWPSRTTTPRASPTSPSSSR